MKLAFSYRRWSTESQTDRDSGIRQTNSAKKWIETHGTALGYVLSNDTFTDAGKSGFKGKNIAVDEYGVAKGELIRFIQSVESGKIPRNSILLIDEISRFSRLPLSKAVPLFMEVVNAGIGLVFTSSYDKRVITAELINNEAFLLPSIVSDMFRVNKESEEKGKKVRAAKQTLFSNIKSGIIQRNNLPSYFTFIPNEGSKSIGVYVHNEKTALVKELATMFLGGMSLYSIAGHFNTKGIKSIKGKEWSGNSVSHILKNRLLIGEYKGVKNFVPPVITVAEFNKIQTRLDNNNFHGQTGEVINIFRGICFCPECNRSMSVMASKYKDSSYRYLRCSGSAIKGVKCSNRMAFRLEEMERDFFTQFLFKSPTQLLNEGDNKEAKQIQDNIAANTVKLNKVSRRIANLVSMDMDNVDEIKLELSKLNAERDTLKDTIDRLNRDLANIQDAPDNFADLKKLLSDVKTKQTAFDKLITKDTVDAVEWSKVSSENKKTYTEYCRIRENISETLKDNYVREGIRIMLPPLIGKITVDTKEGRFSVWNRMGKLIFKSDKYQSNRNCSPKWLAAMEKLKKAA